MKSVIRFITTWVLVGLMCLPSFVSAEEVVAQAVEQLISRGIITGKNVDVARQFAWDMYVPAKLTNMSVRGQVTATKNMITGFVVGKGSYGSGRQFLIRAVGPSLREFNVTGVISDPVVTVHIPGNGKPQFNDDWQDDLSLEAMKIYEQQAGAFPLKMGERDAAIVVWIPEGTCTVEVSGFRGSTGEVLLEVYELTVGYGKGY